MCGFEPPCLGEPIKLSVLRLMSSLSCWLPAASDYESEGTKSAPLFAHTLVYYNILSVVGWSPMRLAAVFGFD